MQDMDIDSTSFDPKKYVLNMLKNNSIKDLIKKSNQIEEDIKIHDHEIQSLVFENYSKFISSIDTVREMKNNICEVDDKLKILDSSMDKISELALKIDSKFSVKRKEIQKLDTINKDLQKLKNLCDFPNVLKQDLQFYRSLGENKLQQEANNLFNKSIESYQGCYSTLVSLKDEALISPIYKQSVNKVDEVRTILRSLQTQFKNKTNSKILRQVTRKLLIVTEDQVSVLRSYFLPWKDRLNELPFKGEKVITEQSVSLVDLLSAQIPELNQGLWDEFEAELHFLGLIKPKLKNSEEIQLLVNNYVKDIFNHVLGVYSDAVPTYCSSIKSFVQVNHMIVNRITEKLKSLTEKARIDMQGKLFERVSQLGKMMLRFLFGRLKLSFLKQVSDSKRECESIEIVDQSMKLAYQKILNPLKDHISINYKALLNDLQFLQNNYKSVFESSRKLDEVLHQEVEQFLRAVSYLTERQPQNFSEEVYSIINQGYGTKMHRNEKKFIENSIKEYINSQSQQMQTRKKSQSLWFVVVHYFLNILMNHYGKKIIENTQTRLEIEVHHDYAKVFSYIKSSISKNLITLSFYYADLTTKQTGFNKMIWLIEDFINSVNIIFPDSRRALVKKPSFLSEYAIAHETEMLTAKKSPLLDKKDPCDRGSIVSIFVRKVLKQTLIRVRSNLRDQEKPLSEQEIYSLVQIGFQMISVEEEGQVSAFYHLVKTQCERVGKWSKSREEIEEYYSNQRKNIGVGN